MRLYTERVVRLARSPKMLGVLSIPASLLFLSCTSVGTQNAHPYRYSAVDMPVSLALGTVRTPEFVAGADAYWLMIQVEPKLPYREMRCMMAVTLSSFDSQYCAADDPLLRADWSVWNGAHMISSGSSTKSGDDMSTKNYMFKFLGGFKTVRGQRYVVEVKFTKDGTSLNVANPHLIVVKQGYE